MMVGGGIALVAKTAPYSEKRRSSTGDVIDNRMSRSNFLIMVYSSRHRANPKYSIPCARVEWDGEIRCLDTDQILQDNEPLISIGGGVRHNHCYYQAMTPTLARSPGEMR